MDLSGIMQALKALSGVQRPMRLRLLGNDDTPQAFDETLLVQSIDVTESLNNGIHGTITCVSTRSDLSLPSVKGRLVELQLVVDTGSLRPLRAIVDRILRGESDGGLTAYQLHVLDPLNLLLDRHLGTYLTNDRSVVQVTDEVLGKLCRDNPGLGSTFTWVWCVDPARHPQRAFWLQKNECLTTFLTRQWRRYGISWFWRPKAGEDRLELVLFDHPFRLAANPAGEIRYHRLDGTEPRASILRWVEASSLAAGQARRWSYDYKPARMNHRGSRTKVDHGKQGSQIAYGMTDERIEEPHAGADWDDFQRLVHTRMERHEFESAGFFGISGQCSLAVGACTPVGGLPGQEFMPEDERLYTFIELHHQGENNIKPLSERVTKLLALSEQLQDWQPTPRLSEAADDPEGRHKYLNAFRCVKHGTPLPPLWDPDIHLPRMQPMTVIVSGADGETVDVDEQGRLLVIFPGEASGRRSARIRFNAVYAGPREGMWFPLKCGMEAAVEWENGDESRPVIVRTQYNGANMPPMFEHCGSVRGNRHMAGIHLHEIGGTRYGELVFDMTTGQISVSLGSEHARSRLQLGALHGKRRDGQAPPIGEGFYLHTQAAGAIRTAQALLLSACARLQDSAGQLDMQEHIEWMQQGIALLDNLGRYAAQHQGLPTDEQPRAALRDDLRAAAAGSNVDPQGQGGAPTLSLTAPAGIAATTPRTIFHYAGVNIDSVAGMNLQYTSGQRMVFNAGKGASIFAHTDGIRLISHHGPMLLQSQHDDTRIESAGDLTLAAQQTLNLIAKNIRIVANDGSYITLQDAITLGSKGHILSKGTRFPHSGPDSMNVPLPSFGEGASDQKFALREGGHEGPIAALQHYEITMTDGSTRTGRSDADGLTGLLQHEAMHIASIRLLDKEG